MYFFTRHIIDNSYLQLEVYFILQQKTSLVFTENNYKCHSNDMGLWPSTILIIPKSSPDECVTIIWKYLFWTKDFPPNTIL